MANGNGSPVKVLGVVGLVCGIAGGAFGISEVVGRDKDIAAIRIQQAAQTEINRDREGRISRLEAQYDGIKTALDRIEGKLDRHMGQ